MDPDGSNPIRMTSGNRVDDRPDWSPDGSITFSRNGRNICAMDSDGLNVTQVTDNRRDESASSYSPDGTMIAFNREDPNGRSAYLGLWREADGSTATKLTSGVIDFAPDWQSV